MILTHHKKIVHLMHKLNWDKAYMKKMNQPEKRKGMALFNAFILDCRKSVYRNHVASYASHGDLT